MESNRNRLYHSLGPGTRVSRNGYRGHMKASRYNPHCTQRCQTFPLVLVIWFGLIIKWVFSDVIFNLHVQIKVETFFFRLKAFLFYNLIYNTLRASVHSGLQIQILNHWISISRLEDVLP